MAAVAPAGAEAGARVGLRFGGATGRAVQPVFSTVALSSASSRPSPKETRAFSVA
ncbi:hypothetical protein [Streptomyces sp. NPDC101181]|uniref:hypothetical protein n=1 Tax=Streptomyces sp. NPDC101181 TaxID=3366125 RepID=UPI00381233FB